MLRLHGVMSPEAVTAEVQMTAPVALFNNMTLCPPTTPIINERMETIEEDNGENRDGGRDGKQEEE